MAETGRSCWGRGQQDASGNEADAGSRNPGSVTAGDGEGKGADKKNKHSDSIALTKGMLIAAQRLCRDGLALSGAHAPALPKGEPLACRSRLRWTRKAQFTAKWSASLF